MVIPASVLAEAVDPEERPLRETAVGEGSTDGQRGSVES
jgi:hypothetical protein